MSGALRKTGIKTLGEVPWGTHFCQFYHDQKDLLDVLVPFFKAGLESNEFCMWICSEPLDVEQARKALRKAVPRLGAYEKKGKIEILSHAEWYLKNGRFGAKRILKGWVDKLNAALARGCDGLRLSEATSWLEKEHWADFTAYEESLDNVISKHPMIALCAYSLDRHGAQEAIDVIRNHEFSLIRREGEWALAASSAGSRTGEELEKSEERLLLAQESPGAGVWDWKSTLSETSRILEGFFTSLDFPMAILDKDLRYVRVNESYARACRRKAADFAERGHFDFYPHPENEALFRMVLETREPFQAAAKPFFFPDHSEWATSYWDWSLSPILDRNGNVEFLALSLKDVTAGTKALEQLQRSEELLRNIFETVPIGIWVLSSDGRILYANPGVQKIWGGVRYVGMEDFGQYKAWHPETGEIVKPEEWAGSRAVLDGEIVLNQEVEIEGFDGVRKIIYNSAAPLLDAQQRISGAIIINQDITEWRRIEKSLREQAALLDLAHDAIYDCDLDGTIRFWNRGAEAIYGWTREEALGKISHEFLQTRFPEPLERIVEDVFRIGRWEGEFVQVKRNGEQLIASGKWTLKVDERGKPTGILKVSIDITESKKNEQALRASSQYMRSLIEASLDPLVTISPEGRITDVNRATEFVTGYPRTELIGSDFSVYFTDPLKAREGYQRAFSKGEVRDYPLAIRNALGGVTEVLYNATVYTNEAGAVQGVFAAARDITERKKAEGERLLLAKALEQTAEGIAILDLDREVRYINPAFERISGFLSQDILRSTYDDLLRAAGTDDALGRTIQDALIKKERWTGHMVRNKTGGEIYEVDVTISPVIDEAGNLRNFVAIERDVTDEVRLQDNVRQGQKMEALGTLAGGIAHDFNNILMPILLNSELAVLNEPEGSAAAKRLKIVIEAANRGKDLVKQIIAFSRRRGQEKDYIRINPTLKEGLKFLRASIPKNIDIVDDIGAETGVVLADSTRIHQVLMNLCSNAAYSMREKGGTLVVGLSELEVDSDLTARFPDLKPGPYLKLVVSDTGLGMTPEVRRKAFDPFFTTKAPGEGSGMGLSVVHGIVRDLGGAIAVESEVGKGATFTVFLPKAQGKRAAGAKIPEPPLPGNERILFVDDEEIQLKSVPPVLEHLGYRVAGQTDALAALEIFRRRPDDFDVVITDQMMPSMTGETLAAELKKIRPEIPIILCTGFSETVDEEQSKALGIGTFLMKPFSVEEIAAAIRGVLKPKS